MGNSKPIGVAYEDQDLDGSLIQNSTLIDCSIDGGSWTPDSIASAIIRLLGTNTGSIIFIGTSNALTTDNTELFWDNTLSRLGVGTNSPAAKLQVSSSESSTEAVITNATLSALYLGDGSSNTIGGVRYSHSVDRLALRANDTDYVFLTSDGKVGIGTETPQACAQVDITSTTTGFLPPRMTTVQRDAIVSPVSGLIIYNSTTNKLNVYGAAAWEEITSV